MKFVEITMRVVLDDTYSESLGYERSPEVFESDLELAVTNLGVSLLSIKSAPMELTYTDTSPF